MTLHSNLIDGEWVGGEAIPNINPSNLGDVVGEYARATAADAAAAGFTTRVLLGLVAGVAPASTEAALKALVNAGVELSGNPR